VTWSWEEHKGSRAHQTLDEICLQLLLIRKIPVTPDLPLNIKLNVVTLDFDSVVAHVNFGMLTRYSDPYFN
jgi:hypothetical protein